MINEIKYNSDNMNVMLRREVTELLDGENTSLIELNIDVRDYITLHNNKYQVYILKVLEKFNFVLRQHIFKFVLQKFKNNEARKMTSINTYIHSLEDMKFIKKIKLNNNNFYMITQKGYIYLYSRNDVQAKRKPDDSILREKVFAAQYFIDHEWDIDQDFFDFKTYRNFYESIYNYLGNDSTFQTVSNINYIDDYITVENIYREYYDLEPLKLENNYMKNMSILVNDEHKLVDIEVSEIGFLTVMEQMKNTLKNLKKFNMDSLYKEIEGLEIKTPLLLREKKYFLGRRNNCRTHEDRSYLFYLYNSLKVANDTPVNIIIQRLLTERVDEYQKEINKAIMICESYIDYFDNKFYLSSAEYIEYQYNLLYRYIEAPDVEKRNLKRDVLSSSQHSKIYLSNFSKDEIELTILDMGRNSNWYKTKLFEVDKILRRFNMLCEKSVGARFVIYTDNQFRKDYVKSIFQQFFKDNKVRSQWINNINYNSPGVVLSYLNDDKGVYFIKDKFETRINKASCYLEKGSRDKEKKITSDEIIIEKLK